MIDSLDVSGCIVVRANNVRIRRTRVRGYCQAGAIDTAFGKYSGILIDDVEIDGLNQNPQGHLLGNSGFTCRRCDIHNGGSGVRMSSDVVVEDSWIHDLHGRDGSHNSAVGSNGGMNLTIRRNNIDINTEGGSGAFVLYGDFSPIENVLAEGNLLNGGAYCTYAGSLPQKRFPHATGVRYVDNQFGSKYNPQCGTYGPVAFFDPSEPGNVWTGNTWADTGQPVLP